MTSIVTTKTFPGGGATNVMQLNAPPGYPKMQIAFSRDTGVVTVTAKAFGAATHTPRYRWCYRPIDQQRR